jgi:hypothetical protein
MPREASTPQPGAKNHEVHPAAAAPLPSEGTRTDPPKRSGRRKKLVMFVGVLLLVWLVVAYLVMPALWTGYTRRHPSLADIPGISHTKTGIPGDPLNVALIGTKAEVMKIMVAAKWFPADPLTLRSCLQIAAASVLKRPDKEAPVSNLYLWGRKQDLAFEQAVGNNPRQRHHVRFWRSDIVDQDDRPVWTGAAIYDRRVGLSHRTGQVTHHTGADIDAERDKLFHDLEKTGDLAEVFIVKGFHKIPEGRNGGGDPWHTDGNLYSGVIKPASPKADP